MSRLPALVLTAILVCSLPALGVPGAIGQSPAPAIGSPAGAQPAIEGGSIDWLALSEGPAASGEGYVAIDFGATLADDSSRLEARYDEHRVDARIENADSDAQRRAIIREESDQLEESVAQLRERERAAYAAYYESQRTERDLLAELAVIHTNAVALEAAVASIEDHDATTPGVSLDGELEEMEVATRTMQGPVRERVAAMIHGEAEPTRVHVESDGDGVVLALIEGEQFHREAHRLGNRDTDAEAQYTSLGESEERIAELYPSVFSEARWSYSEVGHGTHRGTANHPQGSLTVFLDTATGDVYREFQTLRLDRLDTETAVVETGDGVTVTVGLTAPGGPAKVMVTATGSGAALSGEVTLNDRVVGETDDGTVWFVAPRDSVTGAVNAGGEEIEFTVPGDSADQESARATEGS
ncbi:DUF7096 domain-containing protein [Halalkalicoccus jeotgali]|uniref:Uncharacterized protein n=1 Tax=Halalkalicoccus jeotgali (strain DSM 18796 / CECT 7217 / JCM 14584 / KCTC 4019 / B3) TaxID=795797 RepID=D8J5W1_HALJB|nr:hypothetical protein [Halalkalicoccus jeotgali]ADJ13767.1 hypothetical protein HacjB3_01870 [Halalkalicoccus jeotgali B3]ELY34187.1 hypothetical protein C497_17447 [Halalkalicoccus jeotgali B3]